MTTTPHTIQRTAAVSLAPVVLMSLVDRGKVDRQRRDLP